MTGYQRRRRTFVAALAAGTIGGIGGTYVSLFVGPDWLLPACLGVAVGSLACLVLFARVGDL